VSFKAQSLRTLNNLNHSWVDIAQCTLSSSSHGPLKAVHLLLDFSRHSIHIHQSSALRMSCTSPNEECISIHSQFEVITMPEIESQHLYEEALERIRGVLKGYKLFVSLSFCDFHKDMKACNETLANVIVGPLKPPQVSGSKACFLLKSVPMQSYQNYTKRFLSKLFEECMVCYCLLLS